MICDNITTIGDKIRRAAEKSKRITEGITLVCVTKNRSVEEIKEVINCGITEIGENKVQEALLKYNTINYELSTTNSLK